MTTEVNMSQFEVFFPDEIIDDLDNNNKSATNQQSYTGFSLKQLQEVE